MKLKHILKNTRKLSRVLFFAWIFYSFGFQFILANEDVAEMPMFSLQMGFVSVFLMPALLIEYKKNPCFEHIRKYAPSKKENIWGIILLEFAPFLMGYCEMFELVSGKKNWIGIVVFLLLGLFALILGALLVGGYVGKEKYSPSDCFCDGQSKEKVIAKAYRIIRTVESERSAIKHSQKTRSTVATDISYTDGMDGHIFEHYCADLLKKNGFSDVSVTPGSGDQGVDILATKDGIKYAIQCKCYTGALSNKPIQEVNAGKMYYNCHVGVVMTNSTFTQGAQDLAKATNVLLWDRETMQNMLNNYI